MFRKKESVKRDLKLLELIKKLLRRVKGLERMFGIECNKCHKKFTSEFILIVEGICVYCYCKVNNFYVNGELVTKQEAIEKNKMFEGLIKEEYRKYRRYQ